MLSSSQSSSANTSLSSLAAAAAAVSCDMQTPPISSSHSGLNTARSSLSLSSPSSAGSAKVTVSRDQKMVHDIQCTLVCLSVCTNIF